MNGDRPAPSSRPAAHTRRYRGIDDDRNTHPYWQQIVLLCCLLLCACTPSDRTLAELGRRGAIQTDAPIKADATTIINAPASRVWQLLIDVAAWPSWQPDIANVSTVGKLTEGATFTWKTGDTTIHSHVVLLAPPLRLAWIGRASIAHAVHVFVLTPFGPQVTRIESRESMDGPLLRWFYDSAALQASETSFLHELKQTAEASSGTDAAKAVHTRSQTP